MRRKLARDRDPDRRPGARYESTRRHLMPRHQARGDGGSRTRRSARRSRPRGAAIAVDGRQPGSGCSRSSIRTASIVPASPRERRPWKRNPGTTSVTVPKRTVLARSTSSGRSRGHELSSPKRSLISTWGMHPRSASGEPSTTQEGAPSPGCPSGPARSCAARQTTVPRAPSTMEAGIVENRSGFGSGADPVHAAIAMAVATTPAISVPRLLRMSARSTRP